MRTGLAIKDDQLHRWSAAEPGVLGPGIPTPFRAMLYGPSADGRSVISADRRPGLRHRGLAAPAVRRALRPPGMAAVPGAWTEQSPDGRFAATWISKAGATGDSGGSPGPTAGPRSARRAGTATGTHAHLQYAGQFDPRGASAVLWWFRAGRRGHKAATRITTSGSWTRRPGQSG